MKSSFSVYSPELNPPKKKGIEKKEMRKTGLKTKLQRLGSNQRPRAYEGHWLNLHDIFTNTKKGKS
jgi:hypothetical protein